MQDDERVKKHVQQGTARRYPNPSCLASLPIYQSTSLPVCQSASLCSCLIHILANISQFFAFLSTQVLLTGHIAREEPQAAAFIRRENNNDCTRSTYLVGTWVLSSYICGFKLLQLKYRYRCSSHAFFGAWYRTEQSRPDKSSTTTNQPIFGWFLGNTGRKGPIYRAWIKVMTTQDDGILVA